MKHRLPSLLLLLFLSVARVPAQSCDCTIQQVETNTVSPCTLTIGTTVNVSTVNEFKTAISNANNNGGNVTILVADGSYQLASTSWYPYITASNIVIRSASGIRDNVVIHGSGMASVSPDVENGFFFVGDNITIADLTINNVGNHGIAVTGDHLFVHNVKIQDTYEQMLKGNSAGDGADSARVQCSLFEYTAGVGPNWYIGGLDIHEGDGWLVRDNIFKNIASPHTSVAEHAIHFWDNSADNTIERNVIVNCDRGVGFGLGSSANQGGMIRNNMIYNDGNGLFHDVGIGLETSPGTEVYHNTIHIAYPNAIEYRFSATSNVDIANNLCNQGITSRNGGQASLASNVTNAQSTWFVNPSAGDLRLASNVASVVDQGSNLAGVVLEDIDQFPRPQGMGFDIGAQEMTTTHRETVGESEAYIVYPNPARDAFFIESKDGGAFEARVYDVSGREMSEWAGMPGKRLQVVSKDWKAGLYLVWIVGEQGSSTRKIWVE